MASTIHIFIEYDSAFTYFTIQLLTLCVCDLPSRETVAEPWNMLTKAASSLTASPPFFHPLGANLDTPTASHACLASSNGLSPRPELSSTLRSDKCSARIDSCRHDTWDIPINFASHKCLWLVTPSNSHHVLTLCSSRVLLSPNTNLFHSIMLVSV